MNFIGSSEIWSDGIHCFRSSLILSSCFHSVILSVVEGSTPFKYTKRKEYAQREEILRLRSG